MSAAYALPPLHDFSSHNPRRRLNDVFALGVVLSVAVHLVLLAFFPDLSIADYARDGTEAATLDVVPIVDIPPSPDPIGRPAIPVLSTSIEADVNITIAPTIFRDDAPVSVPPPSIDRRQDAELSRAFTPFEIAPDLRNRDEFARVLEQRYPAALRNAGIGGTVILGIHLDETGAVGEVQVDQSSGYAQLDEVAIQLIREVARFRPALNRDLPVAVWINLPVVFRTQ